MKPLAVFSVQEVAHRLPPSLVRFHHGFTFVGVHASLGCGVGFFRGAAGGAAIGETGFIRF
jgi:hypothetical protein